MIYSVIVLAFVIIWIYWKTSNSFKNVSSDMSVVNKNFKDVYEKIDVNKKSIEDEKHKIRKTFVDAFRSDVKSILKRLEKLEGRNQEGDLSDISKSSELEVGDVVVVEYVVSDINDNDDNNDGSIILRVISGNDAYVLGRNEKITKKSDYINSHLQISNAVVQDIVNDSKALKEENKNLREAVELLKLNAKS